MYDLPCQSHITSLSDLHFLSDRLSFLMSNPLNSFFTAIFRSVLGSGAPPPGNSPEMAAPLPAMVPPRPPPEPIPPTMPQDPETDDPELLAAIRASLEEQSPQDKQKNMEDLVLVLSDWNFLSEVLAELPGVNPEDRRFARYR